MKAWRRLDRRTRRELLHSREVHPDPQVAAIAAGYARTMLSFRGSLRRVALPVLGLTMLLFVLTAIGLLATFLTSTKDSRFMVIAMVLWLPIVSWWGWNSIRRQRALMRMENLNGPRPLPDRPAASADRIDTDRALIVEHDVKVLRRSWGLMAAVLVGATALALATGQAFVYVPVIISTTVAAVCFIVSVLRLARSDEPVLVLDATGIALPQVDVTVTWAQIVAVRLLPMPAGTGRRGVHRIVVFVPVDSERIIASASPRSARAMRRAMAYYGSPLVILDKGLTSSAAEITRAAEAVGGIQVSQLSV
ncbi:hypothetical protein [Microtetraspora sp. NBRC 16547]|uniref:hypothetical protein n=1 Tax=Microtetraspora sp. NBRC 16547 TaxID=3030993 RepID=UPI0024A0DE23|nr:hypothetical protein [Microtetraspora sp. NBRC 16547]GLX02193.1 hypothetical protein Misp02_62790 [Microtetraspora sp. NBRC 16547]